MMTIYVGNLNFKSTEQDIKQLFERYGEVSSVKLVMDRETGRPRGFGFVEMDTELGATAIEALNGTEFNGRNLKVHEAFEKRERTDNRSDDRQQRRPNNSWSR
jgi:RNA recognition motif-containing protein